MEMSSLIEWPSIYGSGYFIPAVVVVVLLLALLLLVSSRRRAAAEAARNAAEPLDDAETPDPATAAEGVAAEAAAAPVDEAGAVATVTQSVITQPVVAQPVVTAVQPAAAVSFPMVAAAPSRGFAPAPVAAAPMVLAATAAVAVQEELLADPQEEQAADPQEEQAADPIPDLRQVASGKNARITVRTQGPVSGVGGSDPLTVALLAILGGWGDLTPEDIKRLELFRPEKLAAALATVQLPKSKSGEAKARLGQLRQYSADLEGRSLAAETAAAAAARAAAEPIPSAAVATPIVAPPRAETLAQAAVAAVALGAETETEPETAAVMDETTPMAAEAAVAATEAATVTPHEYGVDDLGSFWAEPRPLWELEDGTSFQELPAPSYEEIAVRHELRPQTELQTPLEATPDVLDAPLSDAELADAPQAGGPSTDDLPTDDLPAGETVSDAHSFFWEDTPADPLSRLSVKVETAEQLLALPLQERADMTAFLGPSELAATFRATEDPDLKKAVIDTLEHIGSPASLNALGNCFRGW